MTTGEVAQALGVTERRARQLGGFLHAERDAQGRLLFDRRAVEELAASRQERAEAASGVARNASRISVLEAEVTVLTAEVARLSREVERLARASRRPRERA